LKYLIKRLFKHLQKDFWKETTLPSGENNLTGFTLNKICFITKALDGVSYNAVVRELQLGVQYDQGSILDSKENFQTLATAKSRCKAKVELY
jgi:hypothetical protein